ncbi:hypothetical protein COR50_18120 [Chitinophaga caeni]|uniref:ABC transporter permease n=1 Tax=Chitinophaga caeni TaxID=2029983 RepID=A0A291QYA9_9BACT|nr:ABC transporter permease [Chitinophaga caeni]ATL48928.1 hypothetical protein COR50_18120 [Chitinophaga caeni]
MFGNYFKVAWRHVLKYTFYSMLNVFGLSLGIAFALLIGGFVWSELQVNRTLKDADKQYLLQSKWTDPNMGIDITTLGPLSKMLKEQYPTLVDNYYRFDGVTSTVSNGEKYFREGLQVGDTTFFSMFGFPVVWGDVRTAFDQPNSVVITANNAIKYFGKTDVVGEILTIENFAGSKRDFTVTAVLKDLPNNSVTKLTQGMDNGIFLPVTSLSFFDRDMESWDNQYIVSYIKLKKNARPQDVERAIANILQQHAPEQTRTHLGGYITPLTTYYLDNTNGLIRKLLYTLSFVALFILLMAIINFINVSISKASVRIKEIGIRKALGSLKGQLRIQFLVESIILIALATVLALVLYTLGRPFFSDVLGRRIPNLWQFPIYLQLVPLALIVIIGFIAGIYPAFVLSSLNMLNSIKGKATVKENNTVRKALIGVQFGTAIVVLVCAIVISQQIMFFFGNDIGYNRELILSAPLPRDWSERGVQRIEMIRNEFAKMPEVKEVSLSYEIPDGNNRSSFQVYRMGEDASRAISVQTLNTDEKYASTYQIPMQSGVFFQKPNENYDSSRIVLNATAVRALGWKNADEAIGQQLQIKGYNNVFTVYGVTTDFHFGSMQDVIPPFVFIHVKYQKEYRYLSFKLKPGDMSGTINKLQRKWSSLLPGSAFEYNFMDDILQKMYQTEIQLKRAAFAATILALVIVLLGVFGLVSLSVYKRMKEIGIRQAMGASIVDIVLLFLKEYVIIILFAIIVASPFGYYIMKQWLQAYAYRIDITLQPFILSAALITLITVILISYQTFKMTITTPMKALRAD